MSAAARHAPAPLLAAATRIRRPTLFPPGLPAKDPVEVADWSALKAQVSALADGRPLTFRPGRSAYPGFEDFPSITAYAGGEYLATLAAMWPGEADQVRALDDLRSQA